MTLTVFVLRLVGMNILEIAPSIVHTQHADRGFYRSKVGYKNTQAWGYTQLDLVDRLVCAVEGRPRSAVASGV